MSSDPSGFVSNPPRTVVKVVNTAREDMNNQLGIVVGYQTDRGRYLVHNVATQQTMALKPSNLIKASMVESAKAQYTQLRNDPRVQQQISHYYDVVKQRLHPVKPEYAAVGVLVLWFSLIYVVGFTKTLMLTSLVLMMGVMVAPDVLEGASFSTVMKNIPRRSREAMEEAVPFLKGRLSNRMAGGLVCVLVILAGVSIFGSSGKSTTTTATATRAAVPHVNHKALQEEYYKLGFDDATNGHEFGTALKNKVKGAVAEGVLDDFDYDYTPTPPPSTFKMPSFGFGSAMSAFYIFRTIKELGTDPAGTGFNVQLLMANLKTLDAMRMGLLGFSVYNLVKSFV